MSTGLVVTTYFPQDPSFAHGVYRRLDVLLGGMASACDKITVLIFVWAERPYSETERARYEAYLAQRWSTQIRLCLSPVKERPSPGRRVDRRLRSLLGSIVSFAHTDNVRRVNNAGAAAALGSALAQKPDIVLVHRLEAMSVLLRQPRAAQPARVFFDLDDIEHVASFRRLIREPSWRNERLRLLQLPALMAGEGAAIRRAHATFVCSHKDKRYLERLYRVQSVRVVPNATAIDDAPPPPSLERSVLFVGAFDYSPNVHAANHLIQRIWPIVRLRVPDARLFIVGRYPEAIPAYATMRRDPSVTFTGFVDDLRAWYLRTRVVCCPIRVGAGTRVKIIEAAGQARPVISTPLGAEGIELVDGDEILLRERDEDIAAACCDLLLDEARARRIGIAAWDKARRTYDRKAVTSLLNSILTSEGSA